MIDPEKQSSPGPGITAPNGSGVTLDAVTTLVHSFASMITAMEARITLQITNNADASKERWSRWESEFREYKGATDRRLELLEADAKTRREREHDEDLMAEARIKPVKTGLRLIARSWKTIALVVLVFLSLFGVTVDILARLVQ